MINGKYVIRNLVSLVIGYRQYGSVAELIDIFFIISKRGRKRGVGPLEQHLLQRFQHRGHMTRPPARLSASYLPKLYEEPNAGMRIKKFRW